MKQFLTKILFYLLALAGVTFIFLIIIYIRPDLVDDFYYRFTTDRASSLILGTSRPAQGIKPSVINDRICDENNRIINHSFAIGPSSFGPNYFREIQQKLKPEAPSGVYIISVDPWSLTTGLDNVKDDSLLFFEYEQNLFVGNLNSSSSNPNFDYLINYWTNKFSLFVNIFKHTINYKGILELHKDGWLEVNISMDSASVRDRIEKSTSEYEKKQVMLSNTRFEYLKKIIKYLHLNGQVYLVRMPVSMEMFRLENEKFPEFDGRIDQIATDLDVPFFNFIEESGKYKTIDTHHLYKKESERFTQRLCDSVLFYNKQNHLTSSKF